MNFLNELFFKYVKKKNIKDEPWLSYYSREERSIKFTNKTIYEYLKSSVGEYTHYYALNYFGNRISYNEMFKKVEQISKSLKSLGVKRGDIVTICMPNTPEAVMMFYACNNIGAIADMVHPLSASNEIKHYLDESKSRILMLYDADYEKYRTVLEESNVYKTLLTSVKESMPIHTAIGFQILKGYKIKKAPMSDKDYMSWKEFMNLSHDYHKKIENDMNSKDMAIILHSGGTTGLSKGIMISNYNFNALAQQASICVANVRPKDKIMTILPIFHGFGLGVSVHCPLCLKLEAILIPEFDGNRFPKMIKDYRPNILAGVPTLWEAMLSNKNFDNLDLSCLKYVISGGDHLTIAMEEKMNNFLRTRGASISMSKGYGMTESVAATAFTFDGTNEPGSIGIPLIGNSYCICKPGTTDELPLGEEGEICVNGPTVMMGYFNNEEETKKVLIKHDDGKIWLHSGDVGYIAPNGVIYFTQRIKRMIISSGFNIYPSAIEEIIESHPQVKKCCVIGVPHPYKVHVAKAYVVLKEGVEPTSKIKAEINIICKKNLAVYSLPREIEFRDSLPKTLYNKIDYRLLEKENSEAVHEEKKTA